MDPNIMKFLEEDEDETMHSGADVEAFTAELNRDIEGNNTSAPQLQQPSDSNAAALSQGSIQTTSQCLPQWHTSGHDGIANFQSGQDLVAMGEKDQHSSEMELQRHDSDPQNRKDDDRSSQEPTPLLPNPSVGAPQLQDDRKPIPLPQPGDEQPSGEQSISAQVLDHEANPDKELEMKHLQNISHHPSMPVGSNDQRPMPMEFNDQQILPTSQGNQQTSMGMSNEQITPPLEMKQLELKQFQNISHHPSMPVGSNEPMPMEFNDQQIMPTSQGNQQTSMGMSNEQITPPLEMKQFQNISHHPSMPVGSNDQRPMPMEFNDQQILSTSKGNQQTGMGMSTEQITPPLEMKQFQNISHHPSMPAGSNDQRPLPMEFNDQQILPTSQGNQQTSMGMSNEQTTLPMNQHTTGLAMISQQATTSGMSNPQTMTSSSQQSVNALKLNKQVPFGMLLPIIQPQLDKDRAMQLHTLYFKLKKNEISKDGFVRHMRSIVGDQMLKMAVYKLQTQAARTTQTATNSFQSQPQASGRQIQLPSSAQLPTDLSNSIGDNNAAKSREVDRQADSHGAQVGQMSTSSLGALSHERKHPAFPAQGLSKHQHMQFSQTSFPTYGSAGSGYLPFPTTSAASSAVIRPHDSQMRQAPSHPNLAVNHLGPRPMNVTNMSSNIALQQNQVQWQSSTNKEQKNAMSSPMTHVKQEPSDQSNEQQKSQLTASHGLSSLPNAPSKLGSAVHGNLKDESLEIQSSRIGLTPSTNLVPSNSVSSSSSNLMETNTLSSSWMPSLAAPVGPGNNSKAPPKKPSVAQKKPSETPGSSPPSSKRYKVSGSSGDQSIEHLNDVTAVSGVNLREEEEQLFSGSKEDSRASEASRRVVQEEEERLILQKIPLQKKMAETMAKCGLKNMSNDVERCLSLCVEERMRGFISNVIRLSKQRVDLEKPRHKTIITSDVRQQIMAINRKAREEWDKKQAETEKSQKLNETDSSTGADADKDKDDGRGKSTKINKEEDDKMRTTAANVAVRAATGVGDITSRWQLMIEAKQKHGGSDASPGPQNNKDVGRKLLATSTRNPRENQESEKRDPSVALTTPASVRKVGRNQVVVPRVARSISVKDVIAVLEREPQMSKSMLIYRLYQKVGADAAVRE